MGKIITVKAKSNTTTSAEAVCVVRTRQDNTASIPMTLNSVWKELNFASCADSLDDDEISSLSSPSDTPDDEQRLCALLDATSYTRSYSFGCFDLVSDFDVGENARTNSCRSRHVRPGAMVQRQRQTLAKSDEIPFKILTIPSGLLKPKASDSHDDGASHVSDLSIPVAHYPTADLSSGESYSTSNRWSAIDSCSKSASAECASYSSPNPDFARIKPPSKPIRQVSVESINLENAATFSSVQVRYSDPVHGVNEALSRCVTIGMGMR